MKKVFILLIMIFNVVHGFDLEKNEFLQAQKYKCEDGDNEACGIVGTIYSMEDFAKEYGIEVDYFVANKYLKKACDGNDNTGCFNLAVSYDLGEGVTRDNIKAYELYKKACELNHPNACYVVGGYFGNGTGKDEQTALKYFIKACKLGEWSACNNAGAILFNQDKTQDALKCFKKACEHGDEWGCKNANILE